MIAHLPLIVDASVALKWVCGEEGSERALELLEFPSLQAPSIWISECANALWRRVLQGSLSQEQAERGLSLLGDIPVQSVDLTELVPTAFQLALSLRHPVYDCLYVAAAQRCGGTIITADRRFHAALQGNPVLAPLIRLL